MIENKQQTDHIVEANKMVTAVQSIIQKINNVKPSDFCSIETIKQWCEQAKEMEKEQMRLDIEKKWEQYRIITNNEDAWSFKEWLIKQTYGGGEQ